MPVYSGKATDFVNFSRGTLATVTDSDGKIKWAPHNLLTNSESFDNAYWSKYSCTITPNVEISPIGTTTADRFNITNTEPGVYVTSGVGSGQHTIACFMKAGTSSIAGLSINSAGNGRIATFDLIAKTFTVSTSGTGGTVSGGTASMVELGSGWFYCVFANIITTDFNNPVVGFNGANGTNGFIWGAHLYRSDLGGMQSNGSAYPMYNSTTPKNLLGYTEDFSNIGWQQYAVSVTKNATIAPNGLQLANKIVETSANSQHYVTVPLTLSGIFTFSVYAKAAERTFINLWFSSSGSGAAYFNLTNGTYVLNAANYVVSAEMISVGNGWYRCSIKSGNFPSATHYPVIGIGDTQSYTGDTSKGVYIWGAQLSDSASLDPYVANHFAIPTSAAYYGPRIDYDPVTRAAKGLLVEYQKTNLINFSADLTSYTITPATGLTSLLNAAISPDGTNSARLLTNTTTSEQHRLFQNITLSNATTYTYSVYAKKNTADWLQLSFFRGSVITSYTNFNLSTGQKGSEGGGVITSTITPVGNSWYRCTVTATTEGTGCNIQLYVIEENMGLANPSFTGTQKGLYVWGAQIETGSFATSYIPTAAATVTRNSDIGQISVNAIPYSTNECTFVIDVQRFAADVGDEGAGVEFSTGAFQTNMIQMMYDYGAYDAVNVRVFSSGGSLVFAPRGTQNSPNFVTGELPRKFGVALKSGNTAIATTGLLSTTYTTAFTIPQTTRLKFSTYSDGFQGGDFMGWIRNITYLPRRVTNEDLQQRTL